MRNENFLYIFLIFYQEPRRVLKYLVTVNSIIYFELNFKGALTNLSGQFNPAR